MALKRIIVMPEIDIALVEFMDDPANPYRLSHLMTLLLKYHKRHGGKAGPWR